VAAAPRSLAAAHPHSPDSDRVNRFRKHLQDLHDYLGNNWSGLTNYAHAHRHRLRISSAPAESGMSLVVNQRMGKRQPMCWSLEGAHFLLQMRCSQWVCDIEGDYNNASG
jgi:hypothetical protein